MSQAPNRIILLFMVFALPPAACAIGRHPSPAGEGGDRTWAAMLPGLIATEFVLVGGFAIAADQRRRLRPVGDPPMPASAAARAGASARPRREGAAQFNRAVGGPSSAPGAAEPRRDGVPALAPRPA